VAYTAILSLLLLVFAEQFLGIYTDKMELIQFTIPSLRVIIVTNIIMAISTVAFNGVVGTGNTLVNLTLEISCVGLYLIYCYFVIQKWQMPLYICWGSEVVYWTALLLTSGFYLRSGWWRGKHI
jgi:Na+-driven multidrug efflux pump